MTPDELLNKWKPIIHATRAIWTWTEPEVLALCAEIASQSKHMIECGSYLGRSAKVMLMANPELHLLCIDTFETSGIEHTFRHFLRDEIVRDRCAVIVGNSAQAVEQRKTDWYEYTLFGHPTDTGGRSFDAIWIDDGHAEEDLRRDITALMPLLKPTGIIFGHDWDGDNDVAKGVTAEIPKEQLTFPHPRVWSHTKP